MQRVMCFFAVWVSACGGAEQVSSHREPGEPVERSPGTIRVEVYGEGGDREMVELALSASDVLGTELMTALASACDAEIDAGLATHDFDTSFVDSCTGTPVVLDLGADPLDAAQWERDALVEACVGSHLLSAARTVAPIHVVTVDPDDPFTTLTQRPPAELDDLVGQPQFTIPPQRPRHQATLALHALDAFQSAATAIGLVLDPDVCDDAVYDDPVLLETLGALLAEVALNIEEATEIAKERVMNAAQARRAAERDTNRGRILSWRSARESRLEAATVLHRPVDGYEEYGAEFPVVTAVARNRTEERAYQLLVRAEIDPSLRGEALRVALLDAMNSTYPAADAGATFGTDADAFLAAVGIEALELDRAALRIEQEARVLGRAILEHPEEPGRFLNVDRPIRNVDWAYLYALNEGRVLGSLVEPGVSDGLPNDYGLRSVTALWDYLHRVIHRARRRDLGSAREVFASLWATTETMVDDRARVCWVDEGRHDRLTVRFHDVRSADAAPRYRVWRGEAGLECAMTRRIGGADVCDALGVEVSRSAEVTATPAFNDYGEYMVTLEIGGASSLEGERIYFTYDIDEHGSRRKLLFGMEVEPSPFSDPVDDFGTRREEEEEPRDLTGPDSLYAGTTGDGRTFDFAIGGDDPDRASGFTYLPPDDDDSRWGLDLELVGEDAPEMRCAFAPLGPVLREGIAATLAADPNDPAGRLLSCDGVPGSDVALKLEDALTEEFTGADDIESSASWYLNRARSAASTADRIGNELYNQHLALDQRGELQDLRAASLATRLDDIAGRIASLCGGHVDMTRVLEAACDDPAYDCDLAAFLKDVIETDDLVDAFDELGSDLVGLKACLSDATEWVAVGDQDLCAFRQGSLPICVCDSDGVCPVCPVLAPASGSAETCGEYFSGEGLDDVTGVLITEYLGIQATEFDGQEPPSIAQCEALSALRAGTGELDVQTRELLSWFNETNVRHAAEYLRSHRGVHNETRVTARGVTVLATHDVAGHYRVDEWPCAPHEGLSDPDAADEANTLLGGLNCRAGTQASVHHPNAERVDDAVRALAVLGGRTAELRSWSEHSTLNPYDGIVLPAIDPPAWLGPYDLQSGVITGYWRDGTYMCWDRVTVDAECYESSWEETPSTLTSVLWSRDDCDPGPRRATPPHCGLADALVRGSEVEYDDTIHALDHDALVDGLELACLAARAATGGCDTMLADPPAIESIDDVEQLAALVRCGADAVESSLEGMALADLPEALTPALRRGSSSAAELQGSYGETAAAIGASLQDVIRHAHVAAQEVRDASVDMELLRLRIRNLDLEHELGDLQLNISAASDGLASAGKLASAVSALQRLKDIGSSGAVVASGAAATGGTALVFSAALEFASAATRQVGLSLQRGIRDDIVDVNKREELLRATASLLDRLDRVDATLLGLRGSMAELDQQTSSLDRTRNEARRLLNQLALVQAEGNTQRVVIDAAMAARINTLQIQYEEALAVAKRETLLAARAIEQRIGEPLMFMEDSPLFFGEDIDPPSTWVPRICSMTGIDYEAIREEVADGDPKDFVPLDYGHEFADEYVSHMVERLEGLLLASYRHDSPFTDGRQELLLSVQYDLLDLWETCDYFGDNLLTGSVDLGHGWQPGCDASECVAVQGHELPGAAVAAAWDPRSPYETLATTIEVADGGGVPAGVGSPVLHQEVVLEEGSHTLSWYERHCRPECEATLHACFCDDGGEPTGGPSPVVPRAYRVDDDAAVSIPLGSVVCDAPQGWRRCWVVFDTEVDAAPHHVGFTLVGANEAVVGAPQLVADDIPRGFFATDDTLSQPIGICPAGPDALLDQFQRGTEYYCPDSLGLDCETRIAEDASGLPQRDYWELTVPISPDRFESGELGERSGFPSGNFNYRFGAVGLLAYDPERLVGCPPDAPATYECGRDLDHFYFSIDHDGPYRIRNHDNDVYEANLFRGRIQSGQGTITEEPGALPLEPGAVLWRDELRGRPFSGSLTLRVYEDPRIVWEAVDDLLLAVELNYWTRLR